VAAVWALLKLSHGQILPLQEYEVKYYLKLYLVMYDIILYRLSLKSIDEGIWEAQAGGGSMNRGLDKGATPKRGFAGSTHRFESLGSRSFYRCERDEQAWRSEM
jgi:hypothetical protein